MKIGTLLEKKSRTTLKKFNENMDQISI